MSPLEEARSSETELKFEVDPEALAKLKKHPAIAGRGDGERLRSVYFDTPGHDLRNAGLSLRVRERGGGFIQTVKSRSGSGLIERGEWEVAVKADRPDAGALVDTPAAEVLDGMGAEALEPVFSTTVDRASRLWEDGQAQVEVSLDQGEIRATSSRETIRELELELKAGGPAALFDLAHELAKAAPIRLSFDSKAERGYRLAGHDGGAALKAEEAALTPSTPTAEAFRLCIRSCLTQVVGNAQALRRVRGPQALHQTRVGLRRMRAVLTTFKPIVEDERFEWVKTEAKWLAGELDQARNLDVFIDETLRHDAGALDQDAGLGALTRRMLSAQAAAYDRALAALDSQRFADFLLDVAAWVEIGRWRASDDAGAAKLRDAPIEDFARQALDRLHRKVRKGGKGLKWLSVEERHKVRIAAKKLRYAAELFAGVFPRHDRRRRRYFEDLKAMQDRLGELNDLAVAGRVALEAVGKRGGEAAFAAGVLVGRRRRNEGRTLGKAARAYRRFAGAKAFWA